MPKLLLIEDEEPLAEVLQTKLQREGFTVSVANDGAEGLAKLKSERPDLVLLDIILPKMSGFDILEEMRKDPELPHPPVIIISNSGQPVEIERAKALGAVDYLVKADFDPEEVVTKVRANMARLQGGGAKSAGAKKSAKGGMGALILVVEDDKFLRDLMVQKLKREGFAVDEAIDGEEALKRAKEAAPSLILLDLILPGVDGFEVLRQLKAETQSANTPVIILSNLGQREDIEKGMSLGAADFLIKAHFTPGEIVEKVKSIVNG